MLLAEHLLLLAIDHASDPTRKPLPRRVLSHWLAVAVLVELAVMGRLRFLEGKISTTDHLPLSHNALSDALALVAHHPEAPTDCIARVRQYFGSLQHELSQSLARRGILLPLKTAWWPFVAPTWRVQSSQALEQTQQLLSEWGHLDSRDELKSTAFFLLADAAGLIEGRLPPDRLADARRAMHELEKQVSGHRAAVDPSVQRLRLVLTLTDPLGEQGC